MTCSPVLATRTAYRRCGLGREDSPFRPRTAHGQGWGGGVRDELCLTSTAAFLPPTCLLLSCSDVSDCHRPFSTMCIALCSANCLAQFALHVTLFLRTSTIPTASDCEEDFGDFPSEYKKIKRIIDWSISRRVDITIFSSEWNHNKNSTTF